MERIGDLAGVNPGGGMRGRVVIEATIENLEDLWAARRGTLPLDQVRRVVVADALVDTGATLLSLPTRVIQELSLQPVATKRVTSSAGIGEATLFDTVRLTVQGRSCGMDVIEIPDTVPVLVGQIPLELLDFTIDICSRTSWAIRRMVGSICMSCSELMDLGRSMRGQATPAGFGFPLATETWPGHMP